MGLGFAAAKELASKGANLTLVDYNEASLENAKQEISQAFPGVKIITVVADVSDESAVKNYVDEAVKAFGRVDGLYNNAGIEGKQASITEYDVNIFRKVIDINLMGVYFGMRYVIRNPTKRLGQPHEVAKLVAFLLSEENGYVSGQTIAIDGGESNIYGNV